MLHAESGAPKGGEGGVEGTRAIGATHATHQVQFTFANVKAIAWATKITRQCVGLKEGVDEKSSERGGRGGSY